MPGELETLRKELYQLEKYYRDITSGDPTYQSRATSALLESTLGTEVRRRQSTQKPISHVVSDLIKEKRTEIIDVNMSDPKVALKIEKFRKYESLKKEITIAQNNCHKNPNRINKTILQAEIREIDAAFKEAKLNQNVKDPTNRIDELIEHQQRVLGKEGIDYRDIPPLPNIETPGRDF